MWKLDCEEGWVPNNWCFWTVVLEKTLESLLNCKEIQPIHFEGDQPWDFFGRNDAKAETPVLWLPHVKSWLIGKDPDAGRDWVQEEKGMTEDEMAGWHHRLDGRESEWTLGVGDGQRGLACCNSWGLKQLETTEQLNWTELSLSKTRTAGFWPPYSPYLPQVGAEDWTFIRLFSLHWLRKLLARTPSSLHLTRQSQFSLLCTADAYCLYQIEIWDCFPIFSLLFCAFIYKSKGH